MGHFSRISTRLKMPSAGLEPATPALGRRRSGPLSYEGMLPAARQGEVIIDIRRSGRSSARLECSVRDREVGSSNLLAPTPLSIVSGYPQPAPRDLPIGSVDRTSRPCSTGTAPGAYTK